MKQFNNTIKMKTYITKTCMVICLLIMLLFITSCDKNRQIRQETERQLTEQKSELYSLKNEFDELDTEISNKKDELVTQKNITDDLMQEKVSKEKERDDYLSNHKKVMIALESVITAREIAEDGTENDIDEAYSEAISQSGVLGIGYCLVNEEECAEVIEKIGYYGTAMEEIENNIKNSEKKVLTLETEIEDLLDKQREKQQEIDNIEEKINNTKEEIGELQPTGLARIFASLT
ncbi:MAG: hypothetical protein KGV46_02820 [Pasteurella sp.]|nr:hypothetical protein [Pasteurella sp.]